MIVLKNLAKEFNIDPHKLRKLLRDKFKTPKGRRWAYEEKSKELKAIKTHLSNVVTKAKTKQISQGFSPPSPKTINASSKSTTTTRGSK